MYLYKSKIIEAFLRLGIERLIFLTKVENRMEHDEEEEVNNDEGRCAGIIYYFSP